jgi:dethiobiotin synthase
MNRGTNIFITGTDTDVGKTLVSAWICWHTNAGYWKPLQTGEAYDSTLIAKFSPHTKIIPEAYRLKAPLSPHDASKLENVEIDLESLEKNLENTVIEGAGGALVPISKNFLMADLIKMYDAQALIVAKSKLGMINHLLLTTEALRARGIDILGIVVNGNLEDNLRHTIEEFSKLRIISMILYDNNLCEVLQNTALPPEICEVLK